MFAISYNKRRGIQQEEDSIHKQRGLYLRNKIVKCYIVSINFMVLKLGRLGKCVRITSHVLSCKRLDKSS
jgi:hypothetical protein